MFFKGYRIVASFTGAWIETAKAGTGNDQCPQSHPLRVRGLKPIFQLIVDVSYVASFTGAWIETISHCIS